MQEPACMPSVPAVIRAFQWDLARQVERPNALRRLLPKYAGWGYKELYLHLEDAVEYPSLPGVARRDAYSHAELAELVRDATRLGIGVVPIVNLLGHTQYLIRHPDLRDLNELRDAGGSPLPDGQVCPLHPRLPEIAAQLLHDVAPFCTAGKVHMGLDESFHLGRCPRCRDDVDRHGLDRHFAGHVNRLHGLATALGFRMGMWADMLAFTPGAIPLLPAGIIAYDWYYHPFRRLPRVELFNYAERDLAKPLRRQGVSYYGCAMNGAFRYEPLPIFGDRLANIRSWWRRCTDVGAEGFLISSWEAYRLALETTTLVDAAAANLWLKPGNDDAATMLADGARRLFSPGRTAGRGRADPAELSRQLLAADEFPFAGYARWEINERWDVFAAAGDLSACERERDFFRRLALRRLPPAIAASIRFRAYLAERDVFVRRSAQRIFRWRRLLSKDSSPAAITGEIAKAAAAARDFARSLAAGRAAARAMWRPTRDPNARGQNERIVEADAKRLANLRAWLRRAGRNPAIILQETPLCGAWQLQFLVHNFAPALQKVVVEERRAGGTWSEIAARFTVEFRSAAARPTTKIRREFAVPIEGPPHARCRYRIGVRGVGQVAISHIMFTNGVETRRRPDWTRRSVIGRPAPARGLPPIDWTTNSGTLDATV